MTQIIATSTARKGHVANYRTPSASGVSIIGSGCSTTDPYFDGGGATAMMRTAMGVGSGYTLTKSTTPGSSMKFRSQNPPSAQPDPWASMSGYSALIIGDNPDMDSWAYTPGIVLDWATKAWAVDAEFIIWNPQAYGRDSGRTYQQMIDYYLLQIQRHEAWQDEVNAQLPAGQKRVRLFPGANVYLSMLRDQLAGNAPTSTWYDDLYYHTDGLGIHMLSLGSYISSMVVAACLWGIDPLNLPNTCGTLNGGAAFTDAAYIKAKVSKIIKDYSRAGVNTGAWA
jgi:hypothetical protein